jgi:hypothetical protein
MAAMQAQLKATQAENELLRRQTAAKATAKPKRTPTTRSPATPTPATASAGTGTRGAGGEGAGAPGSGGKRVLAPSSRLYNPSKLQEKAEKLAKAKEDAELAACSFRPQTKAAAAEQPSPSGEGAAPPKARGTSASNRLFMQAKRHQARRSELSNQKGDLEVKACTFSPAIDERSVKIASVSEAAKGSAFSRLSVPRKPQSSETVNGVSHFHTGMPRSCSAAAAGAPAAAAPAAAAPAAVAAAVCLRLPLRLLLLRLLLRAPHCTTQCETLTRPPWTLT